MRISRWTAALTLALLPGVATGQTPPAQPPGAQPPAAEGTPPGAWTGTLDFGVRGTALDGDAARYERYRDLGDGLFLEGVRANRDKNGWLLDFTGEHVGRRDQRLAGSVVRPGQVKGWFTWDQIPMLLSRTTRTLYTGVGSGRLSIDDALQAEVQATPAAIATVFNQASREFDTRTRRHIADAGFEYFPTRAVTVKGTFRRTDREGTIPYGGSFGHSSVVELPAPTNHSLTDAEASAEYTRDPILLRAGYTGSWFHNDVTSLIFDNPFRVTDIASTPSSGRLSLPPSNSMIAVNGLASVKLPYRSRATAYVSLGTLKDAGDPLIPQTINSVSTTRPLERTTVNGEARTSAFSLNFVSRPIRSTDFTLRYRSYDYDNRTPEFALSERVSYDNAPSAVSPPIHSEPFGVLRHTFDADFKWLARGYTSAGIGYTRIAEDRSHRIFESTTDNTFRLTFDALGQGWFTLRSKYEHAQRRGEGIEHGEELLAEIGEQPGMRHYDVAQRDRNRITLIGTVTPRADVSGMFSIAAGKDDYFESEFGLRDNTHRVYSAGIDYLPLERVNFSASYSFERYNALSRSRQANPGVQFNDPSRNWASDGTDRVHSFVISSGVDRIADKIDLRLTYDFSRARATYQYITGAVLDRTLPEEVVVPTTLPTPTELPPTLSELNRGTADAVYTLTSRLSVGVSYWYERFNVHDFTLDVDANPDLARGQALLMGYLYRPYTANTFWGRLIFHW
ncbi:MAG: MtrB/PioB family outer membrane beta-barrel protein [Vicinamibacterales bacterium]